LIFSLAPNQKEPHTTPFPCLPYVYIISVLLP
jgi:hypothetical protein